MFGIFYQINAVKYAELLAIYCPLSSASVIVSTEIYNQRVPEKSMMRHHLIFITNQKRIFLWRALGKVYRMRAKKKCTKIS